MAGGFIVLDKKVRCANCPPVQEYLMDLQAQETKVEISHQAGKALTTSIQTFKNSTNKKIEGQFVFPLPKNVEVSSLAFYKNGQAVNPQVISGEEANTFLKDLVREQEISAFLEFIDQDLYVLPLPAFTPNQDTNIKIIYREPLLQKDNIVEYLYPIDLYQSNRIPIPQLEFEVEINSDQALRNIYSPTHTLESAFPNFNQGVCSFKGTNFFPTSDFALQFSVGTKDVSANMMAFREVQTQDGYFYLEISPATQMQTLEIVEKDITFVLDCSGSMVGEKMEQAKRALSFCVENLNPGDRFNIVNFSLTAKALYGDLRPFSENTLLDAQGYIQSLRATGGTNIEQALKLALSVGKQYKRPYMVVFITDGKPTIGETKVEPLIDVIKKANLNKAKIFTFGIGDDLNTRLLQRIVDVTKSHLTYIGTSEDIELKVSSFYTKVSSPVLTDVTLKVEGSDDATIQPENLPDLYLGNPLLIYGKYEQDSTTQVTIQGKMKNGQTRQFTYDLEFEAASENAFIPPIWASRRIGSILDEMRSKKETPQLKKELAQLARRYGILTPYTIHLIAEEERSNKNIPKLLAKNKYDEELLDNTKRIYQQMLKEEEGASSVQSSRAINKMIQADNLSEIAPAQDKLNTIDKKENPKYFIQEIKTLNGRAFYKTENTWVDSQITEEMDLKKTLVFNSPQYYQIIEEIPEIYAYLALGKNVKFVCEGKYYQVIED